MNYHLFLLIILLVSAQATFAQDCVRLACGQDDQCSIAPARLVAAFPPGFKVTSIGGNTKIGSRGEMGVLDCRPVTRLPSEVSLDRGSMYGSVQIAGRLEASGILRFEPNDGGNLDFRPTKEAFRSTGKFFRTNFRRIKLDGAQPPVAVNPPKSLAKADCWQANATAELSDFSVVVGDTSAAGVYAQRARITRINSFTKCIWSGE